MVLKHSRIASAKQPSRRAAFIGSARGGCSVRSSSLVALAPAVPAFLSQTTRADTKPGQRILVVIQLDGGNDGINTVVPYRDEAYAKNRKTLRLPTNALIKLNDDVALHPSMRSAAELLEDGRLAIVQGVGYPNPNRSHEVSMNIWHTAQTESSETSAPRNSTTASWSCASPNSAVESKRTRPKAQTTARPDRCSWQVPPFKQAS
jgi:uncharacterized protein (DUF1501 family)